MKYTEVRNPRFSAPDHSSVDMQVYFEDLGEFVSFTAVPGDVMEYGRELYQRALAGDFGEVAPYDGPSEEELLAEAVRFERDRLLQELDLVVSNPLRWASFTPEQQQSLADYRQALLDVPQQEGFPHEVVWPVKPEVMT